MQNSNRQPDYSVRQLCTQFDCTPPTVYKLINAGKLDSYTVGRSRRITHESVERIRHQRTGATS